MPKVKDIFSKLNGTKYFSTLDLWAGYHHIPLNDAWIPKTFRKYDYLEGPFGQAQVPAYFQELMNKVLTDPPFAIAYLDDIVIYSKTMEDNLDHPQQVFYKLQNAKLSMKLSKCHFFTKEIQYLSHILSTTGIKPLPSKTEAIKAMQSPKNAKQVQAYLGFVGYYQKFINNFAHITKPLTTLTYHKAKFDWTLIKEAAFITVKGQLIQAPILHYPDPSN